MTPLHRLPHPCSRGLALLPVVRKTHALRLVVSLFQDALKKVIKQIFDKFECSQLSEAMAESAVSETNILQYLGEVQAFWS